MLEKYIREKLQKKKILLMTHIVIGYPALEDSFKIVKEMVDAGVDIMELQIPFSEPIADGPVILKANQTALDNGVTVKKCMEFAEKAAKEFNIPFLFMSYYNIVYKYGEKKFASDLKRMGMKGAIVPDLPMEEGQDLLDAMQASQQDPIFLFSPTTPFERMQKIADKSSGFIYCVARKGVTGLDTAFSNDLDSYLAQCRRATNLPLALGFGVKEKKDVDFLKGKVDIAIIGTQTIRLIDEKGISAVGDFIRSVN
jgi:tryptophan synthase alpha chain